MDTQNVGETIPIPGKAKTIGRFEIRDPLGKGGMGIVYRAWDPEINREVAIKLLSITGDETLKAFKTEIEALGRLQHANIIAIYDTGKVNGAPYIVMEYFESESLKKVLDEQKTVPIEQALSIGIQILSGLEAAHTRGIIHRDITPGNILLSPDGKTIKIADFGIVQMKKMGYTQKGVHAGTAGYMSPEQHKNQPMDKRSDLFSLAAVLYRLLTRQKAFPGTISGEGEIDYSKTPPWPSDLIPTIPEAISNVVMKGLEKDPDQRYNSAEEMARALKNATKGPEKEGSLSEWAQPAEALHVSRKMGRVRWRRVAVCSFVVAVILTFLAWWMMPHKETVHFTVTPSGAEIQIDGITKGIAPITLDLPAGTHSLVITKEGYHPMEATIEIPPHEETQIDLNLTEVSVP